MDSSRADRIYARQATVLLQLLTEARAWVEKGNPLDSALAHFYHAHPEFGSRDRRLFSGTVFSYFRWKGWIDRVSHSPAAACVFAHILDSLEIHPAIRTLATQAGLPDSILTALGTLPPREKAKELSQRTASTLSLSQLVPDWILPMLGAESDVLIESFQTPPPTWLRVSPDDRNDILAVLRAGGTDPQAHPAITSAISLTRGVNLRALPRPIRDKVDIQDLASQVTGVICDPKPGETWWDACCGSGGKTLHLAELGGPSVRLLATDIRATILEELSRRLGERRLTNVNTALWDGTRQPPPEGPFDGILLDTPCSGTGTWHRNPDARWRITRDAVGGLITLQSGLLQECATRLRPGGILVYATCSLTRDENEAVIREFLESTPGFTLAAFDNPLNGNPCAGQLRLHPWDGPCNGMFVARLLRTKPQI